ncbi:MAG: hypothetical protein ACLSFC_18665 [Enterocloster bolteae]
MGINRDCGMHLSRILNILDTVRNGSASPSAVIGGTHLVKAGPERIGNTIAGIKGMGIRLLGFNHCSGEISAGP